MQEFSRERTIAAQRAALRPQSIIFPANPPPLGARINTTNDAASLTVLAAGALFEETVEPYFAPLSTALIESGETIDESSHTQLPAYRDSRNRLLAALRQHISALVAADAATREREFAAFARVQDAEVSKLEATAEKIRRDLARDASWFAKRSWQLGKEDLNQPREQNRVLEYQVLRAAAFYYPELSPAQRRLAREGAQLLEAEIFDAEPAPAAAPSLFFFSPDLLRIQLPVDVSPDAAALLRQYIAEKEVLRAQLRDAIYELDGAGDGPRHRALKRLATAQEAPLAALEEMAERIRGLLATGPSTWRQAPPPDLPAELEDKITAYAHAKRQMQMEYFSILRSAAAARPPPAASRDPAAAATWWTNRRERIETAKREFLAQQAETMLRLGRLLQEISTQLPAYLTAEEVAFAGSSDDAQLMEFLRRYRQEQAYYEYDIAAFEPGLSPAQRRLLFSGAVVRLDLPLPASELQPGALPKTLVR